MFGSLTRSEAIALPPHRTEGQLRNNNNSSYAPGVSAIQPIRQVADRAQAAYGRSDVEQFFADNPLFMGGRAVPGATSPTLGDVEFLTVAQTLDDSRAGQGLDGAQHAVETFALEQRLFRPGR